MTRQKPSVAVNTLSNWTMLAVNVVIGIVITPLIISNIGQEQYGMWTLVWSFIGYYTLLNAGINSAVVRYVARYSEQNKREEIRSIVSSSYLLFLVLGIIVVAISFIVAPWLSRFFNIAAEYRPDFTTVVRITGVLTAVSFLGFVPDAVLRAHERFVLTNVAAVVSEGFRVVLVIIFLKKGFGLVGLAYASLVKTVATAVLRLIFCLFRSIEIGFRTTGVSGVSLRLLTSFGLFVWITQISNLLIVQLDVTVVGHFRTMELVGVYGIGALLIRHYYNVCGAFISAISPRLSKLAARKNSSELVQAFYRFSNTSGIVAFGLAICMFLLGQDFIVFWVGESFRAAGLVLVILLSSAMLDFATNVTYATLLAVGKHRNYAYLALAEGLVNLVLSIVLVRSMGIYGVALGTAIPRLLFKPVLLSIYAVKMIKASIWRFFRESVFKPAGGALIAGCVGYVLNRYISAPGLGNIVMRGVVIVGIYLAGSYLFFLDQKLKEQVRGKIGLCCRQITAKCRERFR